MSRPRTKVGSINTLRMGDRMYVWREQIAPSGRVGYTLYLEEQGQPWQHIATIKPVFLDSWLAHLAADQMARLHAADTDHPLPQVMLNNSVLIERTVL